MEIEEVKKVTFPENVSTVFEAHGGMDRWNSMNNLCFEFGPEEGTETHTVSLKNRKCRIQTTDWVIGYDGEDVWLQQEDDAYKGNARFYHNLFFYFYAMPFVLGDDGITYTDLPATELDGITYDAVKISYGAEVGDSPEDEYIIYLNQENKMMEWLGYTVTYRDNTKSDDFHFIKYEEWQEVNGFQLPKKLVWYKVEEGKPTTKHSDMEFGKVTVTETELDDSVFKKPLNAVVVPR